MRCAVYCFICLLCLQCATTQNTITRVQLSGDWQLKSFPASNRNYNEIFGERRPRLEFEATNKKFSGTTGCNRISGNYTLDTSYFKFDPEIMMTKMACPGYDENIFLDAMKRVNELVMNDGAMEMRQDDRILMVFEKVKN